MIEKGTTNGAVTDFDGKFSLSLQNKQSILVVTYIGYNTKEIPAGNGSPLTIQLQDDTQNLDEVIVVGYSVQKKKDLTGAVSSLGSKDTKDAPVSNLGQAIQGRISGVQVVDAGKPGDNDKLISRYLNVDIFQIVFSCAFYINTVLH